MKRMTSLSKISRKLLKPFRGKESGGAFVAVLAMMVLGALIIGPLLGFMITGLKAGQSHERRTQEFYSADAGVEWAIWKLQYGGLLNDDGTSTFTGEEEYDLFDLYGPINGDRIVVKIRNVDDASVKFRIESTATDIATGRATRVTTYVVPKYRFPEPFFNNAITGLGDVTLRGDVTGDIQCAGKLTTLTSGYTIDGDVLCNYFYNQGPFNVNGNVTCGVIGSGSQDDGKFYNRAGGIIYGDVKCRVFDNKGTVHGNVQAEVVVSEGTVHGSLSIVSPPPTLPDLSSEWQTKDELDILYGGQVDPYPDYYRVGFKKDTIEVNSGGPLPVAGSFVKGANLGYSPDPAEVEIVNLKIQGGTEANPVKIVSTIFVTGNLNVFANSYLDLGGSTIYVWGSVDFGPSGANASNVKGSGAIIAVGDVNFQPNMMPSADADTAICLHSGGAPGDWERYETDTPHSLNSVWGTSETNVFSVGDAGTVLQYDGSGWAPMDSPVASNFYGVYGFSSDNVFAVGSGGTIIHYDGSTWSVVPHGLTSANLNSVFCTSDGAVFVVGDGVILRYDGTDWYDETPVNCPILNDVWGASSSDVWAVGSGGRYVRNVTGAWGVLSAPVFVSVDFHGIWGSSADEVFMVGTGGTVLHWTSLQGFKSGTIAAPFLRDLKDVWGTSSTNVYAVGDVSYILRYNGSLWELENTVYTYTRDLNAVWGSSAADVFAVGDSKQDYVFVMSLEGTVYMKPGGTFFGAFTGQGSVELWPGSNLSAPAGISQPNFPRYRFMEIDSYIIEQL